MRKVASRQSGRKTAEKENLNLLREITGDLRDGDNMVARALRAKFERESAADQFESLKVFPPKWWN